MLSVTCPMCSARYSMSEELYLRKGGGEAVVVTCRKCKAEIRFEAPDEKTKPSHEAPVPEPKPAAEDEDAGPFVALSSGFFGGVPPVTGETAPLPEVAAKPEPAAASSDAAPAETPKSAEAKPENGAPAVAQAKEPSVPVSEKPIDSGEVAVPDDQVLSVRGDELQIAQAPENKDDNGASANPFAPGTNPRLKKPAPPPPRKKDVERKPEPDDEEQGPPSGTPSLTALMSTSTVKPKPKNRIDEDFFAGISGPQAVPLAPPTIDVSSFGAPAVDSAPESAPPSSSEPAPDSIPVSTHHPHKKKKKKKHGRTSSHAPAATKSSTGSTAKPVTKSAPAPAPAEAQKSSSMLWVLGLLAVGGAGYFIYQSQSKPTETASVETAVPNAEVAPTPTVAEPTPAPQATDSAPTATASAAAATPDKPAATALNKPAEPKPAADKPAETKPAADKPAETKPAETAAAEAKPAEEKPAEAKPAVGAPFDQAAAKAALAATAAQAAGCRKGDDPTGNAVVIITFAPSGRVTSANVQGPPFAGTATGGCIAATMRKTQVPPFDGDRITVSKTVAIQ